MLFICYYLTYYIILHEAWILDFLGININNFLKHRNIVLAKIVIKINIIVYLIKNIFSIF